MKLALALAFLSGYIALSYEILWYRAYAFASGGTADTFGLLLGTYLLGLALGSAASRRWCRDEAAAPLATLSAFVLAANALGFAAAPAVSFLLEAGLSWRATLPLVALAAACLGAIFPLVSHHAVRPDARAGARVSYIYLANILGSALGSFLTGFVLLDHLSMRWISALLALLGAGLAGTLAFLAPVRGPLRLLPAAAAAALLPALSGPLLDGLYERLQFKRDLPPGFRFARVVETKSGVVTVAPDGTVYGGGVYDGIYSVSLENDRNSIVRCFALLGLHPAPREVLMIGLSSGSWAAVVAADPRVERLTIVEINPGYVRLLPEHPEVAGLLSNPKVRIEFDDGRRWLVRNRDRRFDAIVSNTSFHWRSNATNILSTEFLGLVRARLREGGVFYYNTTGSERAMRTGATAFPHALQARNFMAVSDAPLGLDLARWTAQVGAFRVDGRPLVDVSSAEKRAWLEGILRSFHADLRGREAVLERTRGLEPVTDDNMGTEWTAIPGR